jgi:hypothetical protein
MYRPLLSSGLPNLNFQARFKYTEETHEGRL